jgi:hypothetical protein
MHLLILPLVSSAAFPTFQFTWGMLDAVLMLVLMHGSKSPSPQNQMAHFGVFLQKGIESEFSCARRQNNFCWMCASCNSCYAF